MASLHSCSTEPDAEIDHCNSQYHRYRPPDSEFSESPAKARWKFATKAILNEVHERNRKWTWQYFEERRDNRKQYVELYVKTLSGNATLGVEVGQSPMSHFGGRCIV